MTDTPRVEDIRLGDLATKQDLVNLATKDDLAALREETRQEFAALHEVFATKEDMKSGFNLMMGEFGKLRATQEEQGRILARVVAQLDRMA
ncbi:hypothetical protein J4573_15215 [Actinomadura barringtoniae]|uniref:Uncharacterized protein n=1 Tax=Actinomadura barringtoniae TaxID=1427535 RepID=A0A939T9X5_9ACTN|nr:hypothetical protein [Actinomadura barringtoniae]MBO2448450.1 hypothetical protein [Actinomadura barringtoniae]